VNNFHGHLERTKLLKITRSAQRTLRVSRAARWSRHPIPRGLSYQWAYTCQ